MPPETVVDLLARRVADDGASPLLTFYDDASGERTELSAVTAANWVAKTANLLVDGLGLGPGDTAAFALPLHWQTAVVAAGCWAAGLEVRTVPGEADVCLVTEGGERPPADEVAVLSLRPLGAGLATPDGAVTDYAAEVRGHGDRFTGPPPAAADPALDGRSHADLLTVPADRRRLLVASDAERLDADALVRLWVAPLLGGGSVVLCRHADPAALPGRAASERAVLDGAGRG